MSWCPHYPTDKTFDPRRLTSYSHEAWIRGFFRRWNPKWYVGGRAVSDCKTPSMEESNCFEVPLNFWESLHFVEPTKGFWEWHLNDTPKRISTAPYSKKTAISNVAEAPSFQAASLGWWWRVWICLTGQLRNISPGIFTKLSHAQKVNHTKLVSFYVFSCCFAVYIKMQKFPAHHCCTKKIHLHCKKASSCCWTRRWYLHVVTGLFCIRFQYSIHRFSPWNEVLDGMCRRVRNDFFWCCDLP